MVVALGARKGQAWIQRNLAEIDPPVISHLGAVLNFAAGTVRRAPLGVQKLGLEWLWRIKEEPALWRRYFLDGVTLLQLLLTRVLPYALSLRVGALRVRNADEAWFETAGQTSGFTLRLHGAWSQRNLRPLRDELTRLAAHGKPIVLDLHGVTMVDSAFIALVQLLDGWQRPTTRRSCITEVAPRVRQVLRWSCADYLLGDSG